MRWWRRNIDSSDVLNLGTTTLAIVRDVADVASCAPLRGIAALLLTILENVKNVQSNMDLHVELLGRAGQILLLLKNEMTKARSRERSPLELTWNDFPPELNLNVNRFAETLEKIQALVLYESKASWLSRLFNQDSIKSDIDMYSRLLQDAQQTFQTSTLFDINLKVYETLILTREAVGGTDYILPAKTVHQSGGDLRIFARHEIHLLRTVSQCYGKPSLYRAEYFQSGQRIAAVVKRYPPGSHIKTFLHETQQLQALWHPNIPNLIGRSSENAEMFFLVLSDYTGQSVRGYLQRNIFAAQIDGFMVSLSVMQGVASALQYLHSDLSLGKVDLEACTDVSSFRLTNSETVVIGSNLVTTMSCPSKSCLAADLDAWLRDQFWRITVQLLFGEENALQWDDWQGLPPNHAFILAIPHLSHPALRTDAPHIRPLLKYVTYDCPSFSLMSGRLVDLAKALAESHQVRALTYSNIRSVMLQSPLVDFDHVYRPAAPLNLTVGDVGYMHDDSFVKLHNITTDVDLNPQQLNESYNRSSGPWKAEESKDGVVRYTFEKPVYVEIKRDNNRQKVKDSNACWFYFIREARELFRHYCAGHDIDITDLILVTATSYDLRFASYEIKLENDDHSSAIPDVRFSEYQDAPAGKPWAKWDCDSRGYMVELVLERYPQQIEYIQLEKGDV